MLPPGPTGKTRADGVRQKFLRGASAMQELIEPMITGQPYPIKGLVVYGSGILHTLPNVPRTKEALKKLDFVLVIDVLPQDHVAWADVVLPEATYLERYDELWACGHKTPYVALREPAIEPLYDTKPGWWMAKELGTRLGLGDFFPWKSAEEYINTRLSSLGLNIEKLREMGGVTIQKGKPYLADFEADKTSPFATASQKIELYSEAMEKSGHPALPSYEPTPEPPAGMFRLVYGRSPLHTFAKTQNTPVLAELDPENEVWINVEAATALGLHDGDSVMLHNQDGAQSGPVKVKATPRSPKGTVFASFSFAETPVNMLTGSGYDPNTHTAELKVCTVRVEPA